MLLSMLAPLYEFRGFILDERAPLAALATLFGGPLTGVIAVIPTAALRVTLGGPGVPGALYSLAVSVSVASGLRQWATRHRLQIRARHLAGLGATIALLMLPVILAIHGSAFLAAITAPVTLTVIFGVVGLGTLITLGDRRRTLQQEIARRDRVLRRSQEAMIRMLKDELLSTRSLDDQLRALTRIGAEAFDIDVVSVWRYDGENRVAQCLERWDAAAHEYRRSPDSVPKIAAVL